MRSIPKAHGIVVPVRIPEPQEQAPGLLEAQGVDQLLTHQAHGGGTQQHNTLLVQANDALIGPEIQKLSEVNVREVGGFGQELECLHVEPADPF